MKLNIKQKFMLGGVKPTKNPNYVIYTLLDGNLDKFTLVSDIKIGELPQGTMVEAELELSIRNERFDEKDKSQPTFVETVRFNLKSIKPVEKKLMIIHGIESNKFGKFTKAQVVELDLPIFTETDWFLTVTQLKKKGVKLTQKEIDLYVIGFIFKKSNYGYSPVFDPNIAVYKNVDLD